MNGEPRYFLTAYGLARKHGYEGSEEDWLRSLIGPVPVLRVDRVDSLPAGSQPYVEISGEDPEHPGLIFGIPRGEGAQDALMITGGTMIGDLNMGGHRLTGIPAPANSTDAINLEFAQQIGQAAAEAQQKANNADSHAKNAQETADAALSRSGGTMTGALSVLNPTADSHAAPKGYVDITVKNTYAAWTVSVPASGWTGDGPYVQTVSVSGVLASDRPHICLVPADDVTIAETQEEAWSCVSRGVTGDGFITFTCYKEKPEVNLTVQIEVNR